MYCYLKYIYHHLRIYFESCTTHIQPLFIFKYPTISIISITGEKTFLFSFNYNIALIDTLKRLKFKNDGSHLEVKNNF